MIPLGRGRRVGRGEEGWLGGRMEEGEERGREGRREEVLPTCLRREEEEEVPPTYLPT